MKKIFILLFILFGLMSCNNNATDSFACKTSVGKEFPDAIEIKTLPDKKYSFLVMDEDSSVWYIETMSITSERVTGKELMFKHK